MRHRSHDRVWRPSSVTAELVVLCFLLASATVLAAVLLKSEAYHRVVSSLALAQRQEAIANYQAAIITLNKVNSTPYSSERLKIDMELAADSIDLKRYPDAIADFKAAAVIAPSYKITSLLGQTEALAGDKTQAIVDYQADLTLLETGRDTSNMADLPLLKQSIVSLGGVPK